jgi:hypothetical protein
MTEQRQPPEGERPLTIPQIAARYGLSPQAVRVRAATPAFPKAVLTPGSTLARFWPKELDAYFAEHPVRLWRRRERTQEGAE